MEFNEICTDIIKLRPVAYNDIDFLKRIYSEPDVSHYVRNDEPLPTDWESVILSSIDAMTKGLSALYIIEDDFPVQIGIVTANTLPHQNLGVVWNVGYAISSQYRCQGYATLALNVITEYLKQNSNPIVKAVCLDINDENIASVRVAKNNNYISLYDPFLENHTVWYNRIENRKSLFDRACMVYRMKDREQAIALYIQALEYPYVFGTDCSDAQIYSNIGMAHSCLGRYQIAYDYLMKAANLGLYNESMDREFRWLRDNAGIG